MDCKEFRELLDLYVDGELSPEAVLAAQTHLEGCAGCRRVEQQLLLLRRAVRRVVKEPEPPAELVLKVSRIARPAWLRFITRLLPARQSTLKGARAGVPLWRRKIALPAPAFALLLIVMLALGVMLITKRNAPPANKTGARTVEPAPPRPTASGELNLAQFDRGGRATIYTVRLSEQSGPQTEGGPR